MSDVPIKESAIGGIPLGDSRKSAQEQVLKYLKTRDSEQTDNVQEQTETQEDVSVEAMEGAESVENDVEGLIEDNPTDDLLDDNTTEQVGEPRTYTVKVNGKEIEVNEDELVQGYSRTADYSEKTQVLSEQRKEVEKSMAEAQELRSRLENQLQTTQQEREQYLSQLEELSSQNNSTLKAFENVDWAKLKEDDPYEYMSKRDAYRELQESQRALETKKQETLLKKQQESLRVFEEQKKENFNKLISILPEWQDEQKGPMLKRAIKEHAQAEGFTDNEINMMIDARSIKVLHDAMKWNALKATRENLEEKKTKKVPVYQKPGQPATPKERSSDLILQQQARLKKTGRVKDAAELYKSKFLGKSK